MRFALLVLYAAGTLSAPVLDERYPKADIKIVECSGSRFRRGSTFEYEYSGETVHRVEGTSDKETGLRINSNVFITHIEGCSFHMTLTNVGLRTKSMNQDKFTESAESAAYSAALTKHDLLFTMKGNGVTSVRPHAEESVEMLNIKRGILSTLNLDTTASVESDVHGTCQTKIVEEGGVVVKSKELSECSDRVREEIGIQSSTIKTSSNMKPLDSKSTCTYTLNNGDIQKVVCVETHLFRPFSTSYEQKTSGAITAVKQQLKFVKKLPVANIKIDRSRHTVTKSVTYDHTSSVSDAATLSPAIEVVMKRLVVSSVKDTTANEFTSLVKMLRVMKQREMSALWKKYFDCTVSKVCAADDDNMKDLYRQYMLDAIAYCGTPTCVSVVKEVTMSGEIGGERAAMFLQSIALVAKTTTTMIRDILDIAEKKPSRQVYLTLGTLINRHCEKTPQDCSAKSASAVVDAENFLVKTLGDCSGQENHERVEQILLTLKAIGNAKRPASAQSSIIRCAVKSQHSNITMSSFDALRGMPCGDALGELQEVVSNENLDADKRIYAFQASMKCPTKSNLEFLTHQYNLETNKQLASYMWTYFTNLLESNNPDDQQAISTLQAIIKETPLKTTNLNLFQYSKHFEKSLYVDSLKTGATAKADVIFHPDGYLPKTASFDMSAKVMGVPMDIIQTAVGIDGVENILGNMFGPDGAIPKDFAFNMFNWTVTAETLKDLAGKEDAKSRTRRAAGRNDMPMVNDIHEAINMKPSQPSGFMSMKVMGQEVRMMSYDDIYAMIDQIDNMNVIQLLVAIGKGGKKTFSKSVMFLEMTHAVPTGLGLPLKLQLSGSTVGTVDMEGKFDIRNMFWGKGSLNVNGFVKTSAVVEIAGSMSTESMFASTGMRVVSNMMVEEKIKGSVIYKQGQMLKINLDTPEKPLQLFKMSSTPFMFLNEQYETVEGVARTINKDNCFKSELIGYGLCTSVRVPMAFRDYQAPYFPLTGPAHFGVSLVRGDDKLTTWQFLTTMYKQGNGLGGVIEFSTPGAVYERKLSGRMSYTDINNQKSLTVSTEKFGKTGAIKVSYNTVSRRTAVEMKHNFFTTKDITTRVLFFNETSPTSKQMGVQLTADYDWYKFKHVTKFVSKDSKYLVETHTEYLPKKSVTAALEFNTAEKQMRAIFDVNQVRQAIELIARLETTKNERGVTFTFVHVPTQKTATVYTGYKSADNKKEIMTSVNIMGKEVRNILGWYKNGDIQSIEDVFTVNGKTAKVGASWENRKDEVAVQLNADIFGKKALSTVVYNDKGAQKFIDISARVLSKEVSTSVVLTNSDVEKSVVLRLNSAVKPTEASIGFYNKNNVMTVRVAAKGWDNRAQVFVTVDGTRGYKTSVGFGLNKYTGGVRGTFADNKGCVAVFFKTPTVEKIALKACGEMTTISKDRMTSRRILATLEVPQLNSKCELDNELFIEDGHTNLKIKVIHNKKELAQKTIDAVYRGLDDSALSVNLKSEVVNGGASAFIKKDKAGITTAALQLTAMGKSLTLMNTVQTGKISTTILVNNKPLPVSTVMTYVMGDSTCTGTLAVNAGAYSWKTTANIMHKGQFGYELKSGFFKDSASLVGIISKEYLDMSGNKMAVVQKAGITIEGKDYVYGWTLGYENQSSKVKRVHAITAQVHYSTTKSSTATFTLADSENKCSLNVDVEYIPTKRVSHFITFNKNKKQLDASLEFLPNMFAKFSSRLEKGEGYMLQTTATLQWTGFKQTVTVINSYINNDKTFMISTNFARDLSIGLRVNKMSPKSVTVFGDFFGNRFQLEASYKDLNMAVKLVVNGKIIFQVKGGYDQWAKTVRILAAQQEKIFFDIKSSYNKVRKSFNLALAGLTKWGGVYFVQRQHRNILTVNVLGKPFMKAIFNTKDLSLTIHTLQYPRVSISFKWIAKSKTVQMTLKTLKNRMMINLRSDWTNKILAVNGFFNKERVGAKLFFVKKSMIFKVTLSPKNVMKATVTKGNKALRVNLQRIVNGKPVNQAAFSYAYNTKLSELVFNYNSELVKKIQEFVAPFITNAVTDLKALLERIKNQDEKLIRISKDVQKNLEQFLKKIDQSIQDFDLTPFKKSLGESATKFFKQLSEVTVQLLKTLAQGLDNVKANTPKTVAKIRGLVTSVKQMYTQLNGDMRMQGRQLEDKVQMVVAMIEKLLKQAEQILVTASKEGKVVAQKVIVRGQEFIAKGQQLIKVVAADVEKRLVPIKKIVDELISTTEPIVQKFIQLAKDFKLRGMRVEDILLKAKSEGEKLMKEYIAKIKEIIARLEKDTMSTYSDARIKSVELWNKYKADSYKTLREVEAYTMQLQVPYANQNVRQLFERIRSEIVRLIQWSRTVDVQQVVANTRKTVTGIITAKTEVFKKQIDEIVVRYNQLRVYVPKVTREVVDKVVAVVTKYIKEVNAMVNQVSEFAVPMKKYLVLVEASLTKHFGPIVDQITIPQFLKFIQELPDFEALFENEIRPVLMKLKPALKNAIKQIRNIKVGGFRLGPLFDMQMREVRAQLEDAMIAMKKEMISLRKMAYQVKSISPKWFVRTSIDASVRVINEVVAYMKYLYKNRDVVIKKAMSKVETVQKRLNYQYSRITAKSFEEVTEELLKISQDSLTLTTGELSNLIKQLVAMDISGPTWKAITDIDVAGRMERLGVEWKIRRALRYAKQANVTEIVMTAIKRIQDFINLGIKETSIKAIAMYEQMDKTYKYLKSIPKKDYEAWLKETAAFTMSTRDLVELKIVKIYETSKLQAAEAKKFLAKINQLETSKFKNIAMENFNKVADFMTLIGSKSSLVYNDLEQPTKDVLNHYKGVIVPLVQKYMTIIKNKLTAEFNRISANLQVAVARLQVRANVLINDLKARVSYKVGQIRQIVERMYTTIVAEYKQFMTKYGHLTWEQIYAKAQAGGMVEFQRLNARIQKYYKQIVARVEELRTTVEVKAMQVYKVIVSEARALIGKYEAELRLLQSQVMAKVTELRTRAETVYAQYEKRFNNFKQLSKVEIQRLRIQLDALLKEVQVRATAIYNANKDKTMKQIVDEIKTILNSAYLKHKQIVDAISAKNFEEAKKLIKEAQTEVYGKYKTIETNVMSQYRSVEKKFNTEVLPELKSAYKKLLVAVPELEGIIDEIIAEGKSIMNQAIRKSVIMGEAIVKAYGPYLKAYKEVAVKYFKMAMTQLPEILAKWEKVVKKMLDDMEATVQECLKNCEKQLLKLVTKVRMYTDETVRSAVKLLEVSIDKIEKKIRATIQDIRTNPQLKEYVVLAEKKLAQLKKMVEELIKKLETHPVLIQLRADIKQKISELKTIFNEEFTRITSDPKFKQLRTNVVIRVDQIKSFVETKYAEIQKVLQEAIEGRMLLINTQLKALKQSIRARVGEVRVMILDLEAQLRPVIEEVIAVLKQMSVSGKYTADKLQQYMTPLMKQLVKSATQVLNMVPELVEEAIRYLKTNPEQAFWNGVRISKEMVKQIVAQIESAKSQDVEKAVFDFYTKVVAKSDEIYAAVTDEWTKKTVIKVRDFIKTALAELTKQTMKLRIQLEQLPAVLEKYYVKALPILKKMINGKMGDLKVLIKQYTNIITVAISDNYGKVKILLEKHLKTVEGLVQDVNKLALKYFEMTVETLRKYWNTLPFKTLLDNKFWNEIFDEVKSHELVQLLMKNMKMIEAKVQTLAKKFIDIMRKFIKNKSAIIESELRALQLEAVRQFTDLNTQGRRLYRRSIEQSEVVVTKATKKYNAMMIDIEAQFAKLLQEITAQYKTIVSQTMSQYTMLVQTSQKIYETATIGQIVAYVEKQAVKMSKDFTDLQQRYMVEVRAFIEEYKTVISKLDVKEQIKMVAEKMQSFAQQYIQMMDPYYQDFQKYLKVYQAKVMAQYEKITEVTDKMMEEFQRMSAKAVAQYKTLSAMAVAKYEKFVAEMKAKYGKDFDKVAAKVTEMISKFNKMSAELVTKYEQLTLEMTLKYQSLRGDIQKMFNEVNQRVEVVRLVFWKRVGAIEANLKIKVNSLKKMTVQQTVDVLMKVPADLKVLTTMTIKEATQTLQKMQKVLSSELRTYLKKADEMYTLLKKSVVVERVRVEAMLKQLKVQVRQVIKQLRPYVADVQEIVYKAQSEVVDTAMFVYNYYNLGEKFDKLKKFLMQEILRIIEQTKKSLPQLEKIVRQYVQDYRHQLQMSTEKYTSVATGYARDAQDFSYTTYKSLRTNTAKTGDDILRTIHKGLVYLDTVDKEVLMNKLQELVNFIKKHITIIQKEGQVIVKMLHPNLKPTLAHYSKVVKTQAQIKYQLLQAKGQEMLNKIESELPKLQAKITALKKQIKEAVMKSTFDIRRDLNISYKVNKNIVIRLYSVVSRVVSERYTSQMKQFTELKNTLITMTTKGQLFTEAYWNQFVTLLQQAYGNAEKIIMDISKAATPQEMYEKIVTYIKEAVTILKTKYEPLVVANLGKLETKVSATLMNMKSQYKQLKQKDLVKMFVNYLESQELNKEQLDATIALLKKSLMETTTKMEQVLAIAREQLKSGVNMKTVLKIQGVWERLIEMLSNIDVRGTMCKVDPELCKLIDEGVEVHKILLNKYLAYISVGKAQVDRAIRELNTKVSDNTAEQKYMATAMIMGNHILTFDGKLYDMVKFPKAKKGSSSPCSYLLARDFQDKKFTLSKLDNAIIVETPQMTVKIRNDGQTKTTIGNGMKFGLPVESGKSSCVRVDNLIMCHFKEQGLKLTVDLKNFFTSISVSGWYKGKSQGLLGTLNNEVHDDWRLPNNMISTNINEFVNAYELSGKAVCKLNPKTDNAKQCDGKTSKMCAAYFDAEATTPSPFAKFFKEVDPTPFMEACARDTKCKRMNKKAHCGVVAAFNALLRTKGFWVPQANECMMEKGRAINEAWTQKSTKMIDVVVMVSQHTNMNRMKRSIASTMLNLHKNLRTQGKFNVRYALIGFGGKGIHEAAHVHALRRGQSIFGYVHDLRTEVKSMPFEGAGDVTNDGYHAILTANRLKFRPGAEKVFIMFNTVPHKAHATGPSYDETKFIMSREANAPLFVFDTITFQRFGKAVGRVIGQTETKLYTSNNLKGITSKDLEMPSSEFKQLVQISKGGLFSNTIKNPKQAAVSLHDAVTRWVKADMTSCKRCVLRGSWTGQSRAVCVSVPC